VIGGLRSYARAVRHGYRVERGPGVRTPAPLLIGLIRERNEALVLQDTLDHLGRFADGIVVYDDASEDDSVAIAAHHPKVLHVVAAGRWRSDRVREETRNRSLLLESAREYGPRWFFYCDADERFEGDIRGFLASRAAADVDGIRVSLFDAYLTEDDQAPYRSGELFNFRRSYGPERRDILMIWRNHPAVVYRGLDAREPVGVDERRVITRFHCQHYGKALSIQHWDETCDYYSRHFPTYREKWESRKGQAIHRTSDFGTDLYDWDRVKERSIKIHPA